MADPTPARVVDAALAQIHARLLTLPDSLPGLLVDRQPDKDITLPTAGAVILLDGDGEVEDVSISPETYHWRHVAQLEIRYVASDFSTRISGATALLSAVSQALAGDTTLGGTVDYFYFEPLGQVDEDAAQGRKTERQILLDLALEFSTRDALGLTRA